MINYRTFINWSNISLFSAFFIPEIVINSHSRLKFRKWRIKFHLLNSTKQLFFPTVSLKSIWKLFNSTKLTCHSVFILFDDKFTKRKYKKTFLFKPTTTDAKCFGRPLGGGLGLWRSALVWCIKYLYNDKKKSGKIKYSLFQVKCLAGNHTLDTKRSSDVQHRAPTPTSDLPGSAFM